MPGRGLEPPRPYGHQHLKLAWLPITAPGQIHFIFFPIIPNALLIFKSLRDRQTTLES